MEKHYYLCEWYGKRYKFAIPDDRSKLSLSLTNACVLWHLSKHVPPEEQQRHHDRCARYVRKDIKCGFAFDDPAGIKQIVHTKIKPRVTSAHSRIWYNGGKVITVSLRMLVVIAFKIEMCNTDLQLWTAMFGDTFFDAGQFWLADLEVLSDDGGEFSIVRRMPR